eukprot:TRINITY_DN38644_c0_g1_i1.p1 TRINITY_DN38644_c0_g1~~TRINITY_DN38644_c0_g1_i1.p1  ORF type:complete len:183 (+),score=83.31 TRINITY_DN38644_c0_g1_i1:72-551(+)
MGHWKCCEKQQCLTKMVQFTGNYTQTSVENYDEFLKALNVGFLLRKAAQASTPVMSITEEDGYWTIISKTVVKAMELKFRLGEEFDETTADGRKCKTMVRREGNKLIVNQKAVRSGDGDVEDVREFTEDGSHNEVDYRGCYLYSGLQENITRLAMDRKL